MSAKVRMRSTKEIIGQQFLRLVPLHIHFTGFPYENIKGVQLSCFTGFETCCKQVLSCKPKAIAHPTPQKFEFVFHLKQDNSFAAVFHVYKCSKQNDRQHENNQEKKK